MATFAYVAMNSSGQEVKDEVEADSNEEAIAKIRSKGYFPTKVKEKAAKKKVAKKAADSEVLTAKLKKKVIGAMIYPAVVITIAVGIVSMIMIFVIPKFEQIFKDFKTDLPGITKLLLAISRWFANQYGWAYVLFSPIAAILIIKL